jgi:lactoylglutathione lyase
MIVFLTMRALMIIDAFEVILYVENQQSAATFYEKLLQTQPTLNVEGMTEFMLTAHVTLGLMPNKGIAKILADKTPHPANGTGIPR